VPSPVQITDASVPGTRFQEVSEDSAVIVPSSHEQQDWLASASVIVIYLYSLMYGIARLRLLSLQDALRKAEITAYIPANHAAT
jgi:hypothetical protein